MADEIFVLQVHVHLSLSGHGPHQSPAVRGGGLDRGRDDDRALHHGPAQGTALETLQAKGQSPVSIVFLLNELVGAIKIVD